MFITKFIATLLTIICLFSSSALAAESFDIDLKELRPAPVVKPASKQQNLEIDLKELKSVKAKKPKAKGTKRKAESSIVPEVLPEPVIQKAEPVNESVKPVAVPVLEVSVTYAESCSLTRQVAEKLGLLVSSPALDLGNQVFTARHDGVSATFVCDPTPAELITYGRLLAMRGEQMLVLAKNDSSRVAIEKLAEKFGLSIRTIGSAGRDSLPQEYLFIKSGQPGSEIKLTIYPAVP